MNLIRKGLYINPCCFVCRKGREDTTHAIWSCKKAREIWDVFFPNLNENISPLRIEESIDCWWEWLSGKLSEEDKDKVAIIIWSVWNHRNRTTLDNAKADPNKLIRMIKKNLSEQRKMVEKNLIAGSGESLKN